MYKCIDNYIENNQNLKIYNTLKSNNIQWYYDCLDNIFFHRIIKDGKVVSKFIDLIKPFTFKINNKIKYADILFINKNSKFDNVLINKNTFKEDSSLKSFYFVNNSNGHALINIDNKIKFRQNRFVIFDNQLSNKIFTPTDYNQFLIEIMYLK